MSNEFKFKVGDWVKVKDTPEAHELADLVYLSEIAGDFEAFEIKSVSPTKTVNYTNPVLCPYEARGTFYPESILELHHPHLSLAKEPLPTDPKERKNVPMYRGLLAYFPDACAAVAHLSWVGNEQHNPGEPMYWNREKSTDHADCIVRHLVQQGTVDTDGIRHSVKVAWRALALVQTELENAEKEDK